MERLQQSLLKKSHLWQICLQEKLRVRNLGYPEKNGIYSCCIEQQAKKIRLLLILCLGIMMNERVEHMATRFRKTKKVILPKKLPQPIY